ncbi:MAG: hypothetical protein IJJ28_01585, partial [Lentisphaeria bacterium]|nr:hypothetical protein [Lentisphaeria bacterium]
MNKKLQIIGVMMSVSAMLCAGNIVSDGVPSDAAFFNAEQWSDGGGEMSNAAGAEPLFARSLYPDDVTVEAELALEKLAGTAASLSVQGVNWGFDGGKDRQPFVESIATTKSLGDSGIILTPRHFFKVRIESRNGKQRCLIDGKVLAENVTIPKNSGQDGVVYLRPHRAVMRVRAFSVEGAAKGVLPRALETPIHGRTIALGGDFEWRIIRGGLTAGDRVEVVIIAGKRSVKCQAAVSASDKLIIPAEALKQAYELAGGRHNARRLELRLVGKAAKLLLVVTDPAVKADFMRGAIVKFGDRTRISYDGEAEGTIVGYEGQHGGVTAIEDVRNFENIGIHDAIVLLNPYFEIDADGNFDRAAFLARFDSFAAKLIACDPQVRFKLYPITYLPPDWCRKHPEELIVLGF